MKNHSFRQFQIVMMLLLSALSASAADSIRCHIKGHIEGYPEGALSHLIIVQSMADIRLSGGRIVPIENGQFDYTLTVPHEDGFMLATDGPNWNPVFFFAENTELQIVYAPNKKSRMAYTHAPLTREWHEYMEAENKWYDLMNPVQEKKGKLYEQKQAYTPFGASLFAASDSVYSLYESKKISSDEFQRWQLDFYERMDKAQKEKTLYSPAYMQLEEQEEEVSRQIDSIRREWLKAHPSLTGLYLIGDNYERNKPLYTELFKKHFAKRYKDHLLSQKVMKIMSDRILKVGDTYPDYTAPDLSGKEIRISDLTKGKVALIDLWASWCGPCRTGSELLIPLYEQYKDRGFTIVGIARERDHTKDMEAAIQKDGYTWTQLVELNDRGNIWFNHGIEYAAGGKYLLDKTGKILAINPTTEEVARILSEQLDKKP